MAKVSKGKELGQILVKVKVTRKQNCRSHNLIPKDIDGFCDAVMDLYRFLDRESIETLEGIKCH